MKDAVAAYLALRRAAGFEMASAEYLLDSFAILPLVPRHSDFDSLVVSG